MFVILKFFFEVSSFTCFCFSLKVGFVGFITCTTFLRTRIHPRNEADGELYLGCLFFGLVHMLFNGFSELSIMIARLPIFYKQRDNQFHPAWAWTVASWILRVPYSVIESLIWSCVVYYPVGFAPSAGRYHLFIQFILVALFHISRLSFFISFLFSLSSLECFQVFPFHVVTLFNTPDGTGSLQGDGCYCTRYDCCQYIWLICAASYIPVGWIPYSKR